MTEQQNIVRGSIGGSHRSSTFLQLNKASRLYVNLGLKLEDGLSPKFTPDYTALVVQAMSAKKLSGNKIIEVDTGITICPKFFYAMFTLSPQILEVAETTAPSIIPPGVEYNVKLRLKLRDEVDIENLPTIGYILLVG